jgi:EmrB/QacA subfamily drug resistance transporter
MSSGRGGPYATLTVLTLVSLLTMYVEAMVIPSLPKIESILSASSEQAAWIVSSYLVVGAAVAPLFGKLGDVYGKKKLYLISLSVYTLAVLLAGFSPNVYFLIAIRAIQGFGFSLFPLSLAIVTDIFPKEKVALAQGIISAMVAIGMTVGMIAGAYIEEYFGWRMMFHIGFVFAALMLFFAYIVIRGGAPPHQEKVDYLSTIILSSGTALILIYLTETPYKGWLSFEQLILLFFGVLLFSGYLFYASKASNPLISLNLLKKRNVLVANLSGFLSGVAMFTLFLGVIYYSEELPPYGLGLTVLNAALTLFPATLAMIFIAPLAGSATSTIGPKYVLIYGSLVSMTGFWLMINYRATPLQLVLDSFITGVGVVSIMIPMVNMIAVSMPPENVAVGLGFNTMVRFLGSSVGPVLAATFMTDYKSYVVYGTTASVFKEMFSEAGTLAFNYIFLTGMIFSFLTLIVSFFANNYISKNISVTVSA